MPSGHHLMPENEGRSLGTSKEPTATYACQNISSERPGHTKCNTKRHINTRIGGIGKQYMICKEGDCDYHVMLCEKHKELNYTSPLRKMDERAKQDREGTSHQGMVLLTKENNEKQKV